MRAELSEARMQRHLVGRSSRVDGETDRVLEDLSRNAFSNMLDYMTPNEDGSMRLDFTNLTADQAAAIKEIREDTTVGSGDSDRRLVVRTTLKLGNKLKALELLGKYLGMFKENVNNTVQVPLAESLREARKFDIGRLARVIKCPSA